MASADEKDAWFAAARWGDERLITQLLADWPELVTACETEDANTALHYSSARGHDKVVARLLGACPGLMEVATKFDHRTALHFACEAGHDKVVAHLLSRPALLDAVTLEGLTALHYAASGGSAKVVTQILAVASSSSILAVDKYNRSALSFAAEKGHEAIFAQLLAACPELIDRDALVLHFAVRYDNLVTQILALRPQKAFAVDSNGWTALRCAVCNGNQQIAERLLAINSEEVFGDTPATNTAFTTTTAAAAVPLRLPTILHAATHLCPRAFVEKLWRMNPAALRVEYAGSTPFDYAVIYQRDDLVELFQWSLSLDEIESRMPAEICKERYKPVIERQCERLMESLNRDVLATVFEYLGFAHSRKRTHL